MFCNCLPNVQLADSKKIVTCLTLYSFFTLTSEVKNYILYGGKELHFFMEDAGKFMYVSNRGEKDALVGETIL